MKRGFTLVEIIIAMMIFSIVSVVALAALVKIIDANKKAQTTHDAVINLSFALESMSREMRSGSNYYCRIQAGGSIVNLWSDNTGLRYTLVNDCASGFGPGQNAAQAIIIAFTSANIITTGTGSPCRPTIAYRLRRPNSSPVNWTIEKAEQIDCTLFTGAVRSILNADYTQSAADRFSPIVSTNNISVNSYYLRMLADDFPYLFLALSGNAGVKESSKAYFTVQTASSPRVP